MNSLEFVRTHELQLMEALLSDSPEYIATEWDRIIKNLDEQENSVTSCDLVMVPSQSTIISSRLFEASAAKPKPTIETTCRILPSTPVPPDNTHIPNTRRKTIIMNIAIIAGMMFIFCLIMKVALILNNDPRCRNTLAPLLYALSSSGLCLTLVFIFLAQLGVPDGLYRPSTWTGGYVIMIAWFISALCLNIYCSYWGIYIIILTFLIVCFVLYRMLFPCVNDKIKM